MTDTGLCHLNVQGPWRLHRQRFKVLEKEPFLEQAVQEGTQSPRVRGQPWSRSGGDTEPARVGPALELFRRGDGPRVCGASPGGTWALGHLSVATMWSSRAPACYSDAGEQTATTTDASQGSSASSLQACSFSHEHRKFLTPPWASAPPDISHSN